MAQAARLNLRMQKELKLLLTDPPPGASFPTLSDDSSASLTSIDAHFKGPEGTVYADGVFKIKIQIPERYPFQPPIVTFVTPIYHPNIDNGGRICLDTLNLPPKGSWQPSLNISTVLTTIGLLLSEANPDDGLMHDASREYKYNRQAFDQKARSMTEKYASPGESISSIDNCDNQIHTCPSTSKTELEGSESSTRMSMDHEKFSGSTRKLSLESFGSSSNSKVPNHGDTKNHIQIGLLEKAKTIATDFIRNPDKQQLATRHKLSLKVPVISHSEKSESTKTNESNPCPSLLKSQNLAVNIPDSFPFLPVDHDQILYRDEDFNERSNRSANQGVQSLESIKTSHKSRNSFGKLKLPQPAVSDSVSLNKDAFDKTERGSVNKKVGTYGKENLVPIQQLKPSIVSENVKQYYGKQTVNVAQKLSLTAARLALDQLPKLKLHSENPQSKILNVGNDEQSNQVCDDNNEQILSVSSPIPEECIVLDSEDSDDENVPVRSKLLLARKHLLRKRKFKTTSDK